MEKLLLIDGHSILSRAFYGIPTMNNTAGQHTNAVYGFLNIMFKVMDEEKADYLAVAFDLPKPTFRHLAYTEYKGTRKGMPEELLEQVPLIQEMLQKMQVRILTKEGYEADDILGTIAKRYAGEELSVSILSGDRDLLQLADQHIKIRIPKTAKGQTTVKDYYPQDVLEEYQVTPTEFIEVKALMGDSSDNIPGVPSIGEKTATAIIVKYHSIENAFAHIAEIMPKRARENLEAHYDLAQQSKWLATIHTSVELETELSEMKISDLYNADSFAMIKQLEFKSMYKRFEGISAAALKDVEFQAQQMHTVKDLHRQIEQCIGAKKVGLGVILGKESLPFEDEGAVDTLAAISLCSEEGNVYYARKNTVLNEEILKYALNRLFTEGKCIYAFEVKAISKYLEAEYQGNVFDLGIGAYLMNPLKDSYDLEDIARDYAMLTISSREERIGKKDILLSLEDGDEEIISYLKDLSFVAYTSGEALEERLLASGMLSLYRDIEMPLCFALGRMEKAGVGVDAQRLKEYSQMLVEKIRRIEQEIYADTGEIFNINSPKQLGEILFEKLNLPGGKKTKTGYSTSADVLEKLAADFPLVQKILEYRHLTKLNSTYAVGLADYIGEDGRIHGIFHQTVTATGRISSTEPNLQNIPIRTEMGSRIRDIFVPKEGYVFVDADYSQIELRILASMSGDEKLIESYRMSVDVHAATASNVFHVPLSEVTPQLRRSAKAVNFGVVYGISAFGLSEDLSISRKEALEYINNYFSTYTEVKRFLDRNIQLAKDEGFVKTLYGRIRPIPELKSSNFMQRAFGDRIAMNSPIQGTAADIMKLAMIQVDAFLRKFKEDARIVLQVHDELLIEVKKELAEEIRDEICRIMKNAADLAVPLEVEAHIGKTWLEAK